MASHPYLLILDTYYYTTDTLTQMSQDFNLLQWISMLFVFIILPLNFHGNTRYTLLGLMTILLSWFIVLEAMAIFQPTVQPYQRSHFYIHFRYRCRLQYIYHERTFRRKTKTGFIEVP
ncbi:MAG: hypothetical protein LUH12_02210 [Bacteroides sp.]|nr:hypothetical protein [Bacteroides sp.]